jgi:hypothetical protein
MPYSASYITLTAVSLCQGLRQIYTLISSRNVGLGTVVGIITVD